MNGSGSPRERCVDRHGAPLRWAARTSRRMKRIDLTAVALAALAAALLVHATARWGPAVFQLGLHNITAAQALLDGREMCTTRGEAFTQWPPLFVWILALG